MVSRRGLVVPDRRYCFVRDNDAHWYLIPAERRDDWEEWLDSSSDDAAAPDWAQVTRGFGERIHLHGPQVRVALLRWLHQRAWPSFPCEDCISMREHGCWCEAQGAMGPGTGPDRLTRLFRWLWKIVVDTGSSSVYK